MIRFCARLANAGYTAWYRSGATPPPCVSPPPTMGSQLANTLQAAESRDSQDRNFRVRIMERGGTKISPGETGPHSCKGLWVRQVLPLRAGKLGL